MAVLPATYHTCELGATMSIHEGLMKAVKDDARRAGEQDRLLLEALRARPARRPRAGVAAPVWRLARLMFRRATA